MFTSSKKVINESLDNQNMLLGIVKRYMRDPVKIW